VSWQSLQLREVSLLLAAVFQNRKILVVALKQILMQLPVGLSTLLRLCCRPWGVLLL
jgi:hypothetical protein